MHKIFFKTNAIKIKQNSSCKYFKKKSIFTQISCLFINYFLYFTYFTCLSYISYQYFTIFTMFTIFLKIFHTSQKCFVKYCPLISPKWQHCRNFGLLPAMLAEQIPIATMLTAASLSQS